MVNEAVNYGRFRLSNAERAVRGQRACFGCSCTCTHNRCTYRDSRGGQLINQNLQLRRDGRGDGGAEGARNPKVQWFARCKRRREQDGLAKENNSNKLDGCVGWRSQGWESESVSTNWIHQRAKGCGGGDEVGLAIEMRTTNPRTTAKTNSLTRRSSCDRTKTSYPPCPLAHTRNYAFRGLVLPVSPLSPGSLVMRTIPCSKLQFCISFLKRQRF